MVKIKIYGKLAKEIGFKEIEAECNSLREVAGHLHHITGGNFARKLISFKNEGMPYAFTDGLGKFITGADESIAAGSEVKVCPITSMSGIFVSAIAIQIYISIALSVAFALLSMLLAPSPPQIIDGGGPETKRKEAYLFDGRARTVNQGSCVPVGYGRMIVPGSVIYNRVNYVEV